MGSYTTEQLAAFAASDSWKERRIAAYNGFALERLVDDPHPNVREAVADQGFGLGVLESDPEPLVRMKVAANGHALERLIDDPSWLVRRMVARQGFGLDVLAKDARYEVRAAIAEGGWKIDELLEDKSVWVRQAAHGYLVDNEMSLEEWKAKASLENGGATMAIDLNEPVYADERFRYQLLSRMQSDCEYFLGYGNRSERHLWSGDAKSQIEDMKTLWNSFPEDGKPEWLTWEQLLEYEAKMCGPVKRIERVSLEELEAFCEKYGEKKIEYGWDQDGFDLDGTPLKVRVEFARYRVPFGQQVGGAPESFLIADCGGGYYQAPDDVREFYEWDPAYQAVAVIDGQILRNYYLENIFEAREWCRWAMDDPLNTEPPVVEDASWYNELVSYAEQKSQPENPLDEAKAVSRDQVEHAASAPEKDKGAR